MNLCQSIKVIKQTLQEQGDEIKPYPENEIQEAIKYFNGLPSMLLEYYREIGKTETAYYVMSPKELIKRNPNYNPTDPTHFIYLGGDYCFVFHVYILNNDKHLSNPPLWADGEGFSDDDFEVLNELEDPPFKLVSGEKHYHNYIKDQPIDDLYGFGRFRDLSMFLTSIGTPLL